MVLVAALYWEQSQKTESIDDAARCRLTANRTRSHTIDRIRDPASTQFSTTEAPRRGAGSKACNPRCNRPGDRWTIRRWQCRPDLRAACKQAACSMKPELVYPGGRRGRAVSAIEERDRGADRGGDRDADQQSLSNIEKALGIFGKGSGGGGSMGGGSGQRADPAAAAADPHPMMAATTAAMTDQAPHNPPTKTRYTIPVDTSGLGLIDDGATTASSMMGATTPVMTTQAITTTAGMTSNDGRSKLDDFGGSDSSDPDFGSSSAMATAWTIPAKTTPKKTIPAPPPDPPPPPPPPPEPIPPADLPLLPTDDGSDDDTTEIPTVPGTTVDVTTDEPDDSVDTIDAPPLTDLIEDPIPYTTDDGRCGRIRRTR